MHEHGMLLLLLLLLLMHLLLVVMHLLLRLQSLSPGLLFDLIWYILLKVLGMLRLHALPHLKAAVLLQVMMVLGMHALHELVGAACPCSGLVVCLSGVLMRHRPA